MKSAVIVGKENIIIEDRPIPQINDINNVLVKVLYCGICGSDIPKYFGNRVKKYPLVLGHEFCGKVIKGPQNLLNHIVAVKPMIYCNKCDNCKNGNYELCSNHKYIGSTLDGGMQEYIAVPENNTLDIDILKDNPKLGALIEPFSVGIHAISLLQNNIDQINENIKIGIIGNGVIGNMIYNALRYYINIDRHNLRYITRQEIPEDNIFDYTFECSGSVGGLNSAIKSTKYKGKIFQVGILYPEIFGKGVDFEYHNMLRKEQQIHGVWNSNFGSDWDNALKVINDNREIFEPIITNIYDLKDVEKAFTSKKNNYVKKIMLKVAQDED